MDIAELWKSVVNEAIAGAAISIAVGLITYCYRMWQLPKLQAETIKEIRELRVAIGQLTERIRRGAQWRAGDNDDA